MAHLVPVDSDLQSASHRATAEGVGPVSATGPGALWRRSVSSLALVAGALVVVGVALPWVSTFAGLVSMSGLGSPNGRVLLALGPLTILSALVLGLRGDQRARWAVGLLGFATLVYGGHLLIELYAAVRKADGMALTAVGPGLPVCLVGGVAALSTLLLPYGEATTTPTTTATRTTSMATSSDIATLGVARGASGQRLRAQRLRYAAAAAATVAAVAHIPVTPEHLRQAPYIGAGFLALTASLLLLASALVTSAARWVWVAVGGVSAVAVLAYLVSRTIGLPDIGDDVGNWLEPLGVVSVLSESVVAALALLALRRR